MKAASVRFLKIVLGAIALACVLGVCLDMVTAHVAVEYFTVHHPRVVDSEQPWVMALVWGVGASWWFGAGAGAIVATINHRRHQPLEPGRILQWFVVACVVLWLVMIAILIGVFLLASTIPEGSRRPTFDHDRRIMAVAMAHQFEYVLGGAALAFIAIKTWRAK